MDDLHTRSALEPSRSRLTPEDFAPWVRSLDVTSVRDHKGRPVKQTVAAAIFQEVRQAGGSNWFVQRHMGPDGTALLTINDYRGSRRLAPAQTAQAPTPYLFDSIRQLLGADAATAVLWPHSGLVPEFSALADAAGTVGGLKTALAAYHPDFILPAWDVGVRPLEAAATGLSHLDRLEAEAIHILREVAATASNPVMLYSVGKDSAVMLHLARKAFWPAPPPFPLLHVDTTWKFQEMIQFRDQMAADIGMELLVHTNPEGLATGINPFDHGSAVHTDIMKTQALKQALDQHRFDVAFGGARRDEEKSRAKERVFSFRSASHRWDPKNQRPELWNLYNTAKRPDESIRAFPISNWTELDIWQYIYREQIPIVPLYLARVRPVVERDDFIMMADDDRIRLAPGDRLEFRKVRFRTLGCYPLTGAVESEAEDLASVILELLGARTSERQGRAIDKDQAASMEKKKQEGYF